jgi:hypothetical protein
MSRGHKDLDFQLEDAGGTTRTFKKFDEACALAVAVSASTGHEVNLDVLAWSRAAARAYGGDAGAEQYDEDPEASVHDRIVIKADSQGRVS